MTSPYGYLFVDSAYAGKWAQRTYQLQAIDVQMIRGPKTEEQGNGTLNKAIYFPRSLFRVGLWSCPNDG
ncbi:hypothetical protein ALQ25_200280 [Pseudomonas coronafaciens pv. atropurpurea]|nr:hypothetical protein ALQ25_200280 [Pseudomonas coronafaciens pv. atropurpurea]